jgi:hypothetical protein
MASQIETDNGSGRFAPRETMKASIVEAVQIVLNFV